MTSRGLLIPKVTLFCVLQLYNNKHAFYFLINVMVRNSMEEIQMTQFSPNSFVLFEESVYNNFLLIAI